jgi:hypothetical protein
MVRHPGGRAVVVSLLLPFLATTLMALGGNSRRPGNSHIVTLTVLGDDAGDYLDPGEGFVLWRGHDVGHGVVTHRIFVLPRLSFWYAIR